MKIKILLVDDQEVVRVGLKTIMESNLRLQVVGEASSAAEAVAKTNLLEPDVVVMDIRMPGGSGIEACRQIMSKHPSVKVLMLTSYADQEAVLASILSGAQGYIIKEIGGRELVDAIYQVYEGRSLLDPSVTKHVFELLKTRDFLPNDKTVKLTQQEETILILISKGKTNKEIAKEIFLSEKTVRNYVSVILAKLNFSHRSEAAAYAARYLT